MSRRNRMIVRKIRNIVILLMAIIVMIGAYKNIRDSRAEDVIEIDAIAIDNYGYLSNELFKLEATQIGEDIYEIELPESVNGKEINQIVKVTLEEPVPEVETESGVQENASTENAVETLPDETTSTETPETETTPDADTTIDEQTPAEDETTDTSTTETTAAGDSTTDNQETVETPVKENTTTPSTDETENITAPDAGAAEDPTEPTAENMIETIDNKITLTKEQIENKQLNIEVVYNVAILETNEEGELSKDILLEKTEEERQEIEITEETEMLYSKILRYEDKENQKLVEVRGYLPKDAELKVEEVSQEQLTEIFGDGKIDVAYDIKIVIHVTKEVLIDETDPTKGTKEEIETIEINPEEFGESCEVSIKDVKIQTESQVYHVKEDNTYEKVNVRENTEESITFDAQTFSIYAVSTDEQIMLSATSGSLYWSHDYMGTTELEWKETHGAWVWVRINNDTDTIKSADVKFSWHTGKTSGGTNSAESTTGYTPGESTIAGFHYSSTIEREGIYYLGFTITATSTNGSTLSEKSYLGPFYIDKKAPGATTYSAHYADGTAYTSGTWTNKQVYTKLTSTDGGSGVSYFQYKKSTDSSWTQASSGSMTKSGTTYTYDEPWTLKDRNDTYTFRAVDGLGHTSSASSSFTVKYDITAPTTPTITTKLADGTSYTSGSWTNQSVVLTASGSTDTASGVSKYQYSTNGSTWYDMTNGTVTFSSNMNSTVYVRAVDAAGNVSSNASTVIRIDKTAPTGTLTASANLVDGTYYTNKSSVTIYLSDVEDTGGSGLSLGNFVAFTGNGGGWGGIGKWIAPTWDSTNQRYYATFNFSEIPNTATGATNNGETWYSFGVHINDNAGNRYIPGFWIYYDTTCATYTSAEITNVSNTGYDVYIHGVSDNLSGINRVQFPTWTEANGQDDLGWGGNWTTASTNSGTDMGNGTWYYRVNVSDHNYEEGWYNTHIYIYDNAGNYGSNASGYYADYTDTVYVDRTPPQINIGGDSGIVTDGLIRYYDAVNNTGSGHNSSATTWKDLSGNYDATVNGATFSDNYLSFDGTDDWVDAGQVSLTNSGTFDTTIELKSIQSGEVDIISNFNNGGAGIYLYDGAPRVSVYITDTDYVEAGSDEVLEVGKKYHIVGTYDGTSVKLYINGELKAETAASGTIGEPTYNTIMAIAANPAGSSVDTAFGFSNINVYDAKVYSRALSGNEVYKNALEAGLGEGGLIRHFDGTNNTGSGHSSSATTWKDLSGNSDGTIGGATIYDNYLSFDGVDDYVQSGSIDLSSNVLAVDTTIELKSIQSGEATIISYTEGGGFSLDVRDGKPYFDVYITDVGYQSVMLEEALEINTKYRITATYDGSSIKLYINGELKAETAASGTIKAPNGTPKLVLGAEMGSSGDIAGFYADINMYEAKIYNRALTQEEIKPESEQQWKKSHSVEVALTDNYSGLTAGASVKYGWSTSTTTPPTSYTTATLSYTEGTLKTSFTATGSGMTGKYYLWVVPETLTDLHTNSQTAIKISSDTYWFDNTLPTITFNPQQNETWKKSQSVTVNIGDAHSGLAEGAQVQYQWVAQNSNGTMATPSASGWTTRTISSYEAGTNSVTFAVTNSTLTGKYYLCIKVVSLKDTSLEDGNEVTADTIISSDGAFWLDNIKPTLTVTASGNETWSKEHSATVTIADAHSGLAEGISVQYGWSLNNTSTPTSWTTADITSYSEGASDASFTATGSGLTGKYYLWIKSTTLADVAGNTIASTTKMSSTAFYFDNTNPMIEIDPVEEINGLTAGDITAEDYGGIVTNYAPSNGSTGNWQIFHSDGDNIYLIAEDFVKNQYVPAGSGGNVITRNGTYGVQFNAVTNDYSTGAAAIAESNPARKWLSKYLAAYPSANPYNMRATAYMMDTTVWSGFEDGNYAEYAIGGPTIELLTESYNTVSSDKTIETQIGGSSGYVVKWSTDSNAATMITGLDTDLEESKGILYVGSYIVDSTTIWETWLASPSAQNSQYVMTAVSPGEYGDGSSGLYYHAFTATGAGIRPVIALKSTTQLEKQDDGTYQIVENNKLKASDITADNYGGVVTNYTSPNGLTENWQIFHSDGENIYLIAEEYVTNTYVPAGKGGTAVTKYGNYGVGFTNVVNDYTGSSDINSELAEKWLSKYTYTSVTMNAKTTAYLLDTDIWSGFKNDNYAEYAIGGPTLELFVASYNTKHPSQIIETLVTNPYGYGVKWSTAASYGNVLSGIDTTDSLYIKTKETTTGLTIASPMAYGATYIAATFMAGSDNQLSTTPYNYGTTGDSNGICPIICLKTDTQLEKQADGTYQIVENSTTTEETDREWSKTKDVEVKIYDKHSGLAANAQFKYGWSTSKTTEPTKWNTITVSNYSAGTGTATFIATASPETIGEEEPAGKYYLWVEPVDFKDISVEGGNSQTEGGISDELYWIDHRAPTITFSPQQNETWSRSHSVEVTINDAHSGLAEGAQIQYQWVAANEDGTMGTPTDDGWISQAVSDYEAGTNEDITFSVTHDGLTGKYYLCIKSQSLKDISQVGGNETDAIISSSGTFWFDNESPIVNLGSQGNAEWENSYSIPVTVTDVHSGLPSGTELQYGWSTSADTEPEEWQYAQVNEGIIEDGLIRHYNARNNTGNGYDSSASTWKDLTGNYDATLPTENTIVWGDVDCDGEITEDDSTELLWHTMYPDDYPLTEHAKANSDVNLDGVLNNKDVVLINGYINGTQTLPEDGVFGYDYLFLDGGYDNRLRLGDLGELISTGFTIETKVDFSENSYLGLHWELTADEDYYFDLKNDRYNLSWDIYLPCGEGVVENLPIESSIPTDALSVFTLIWDVETHTMKCYLDGILQQEVIFDHECAGFNAEDFFGELYIQSDVTEINDIKVYNRALTQAEVQQNLQATQSVYFNAETPSTLEPGKYYLWVKPVQVVDVVGNEQTETVISQETFWLDNKKPTITIDPQQREVWAKTHSVDVTINDAHSGLAEGIELQYQWVKLDEDTGDLIEQGWQTVEIPDYTEGDTSLETITITTSDLRGKYYLWVKPVTLKDVAGNEETEIVKTAGTFWFDYISPIITITPEENTTWEAQHRAVVGISDEHCGLELGAVVKYGWSTSNTVEPTTWTEVDLAEDGTPTDYERETNDVITFVAEIYTELETGKYYLWVVPVSLQDIVGNIAETKISTGTFYIDITPPTITLESEENTTYKKVHTVDVTLQDEHSGMASGNKIKYGWSTSTSTAPSSYTTVDVESLDGYAEGTNNPLSFTATTEGLISTTGEYYLWVVPYESGTGIKLIDKAMNLQRTTTKSTGTFYIDYDAPIWITQNINIDTTNKEVTVDLRGSDALSGYASDSLDIGDITVKVDGETATSITKNLELVEPNPNVTLYGDVTCDGVVDGRDSTLVQQHVAWGSVLTTEEQLANADVNLDGVVDGRDSTLLQQFAGGWDVCLRRNKIHPNTIRI